MEIVLIIWLWLIGLGFTEGFTGKECKFFQWPKVLGAEIRKVIRAGK